MSLAANCARFYRVAVEGPDLFDQVAVVRQWGRIGSPRGQELRTYHADQAEAAVAAGRVIAAKRRKGYQDGPLPRPVTPFRSAPGLFDLAELPGGLLAILAAPQPGPRPSC